MNTLRSLEIVIPVYNEEAVLARLLDRLQAVFTPQALASAGLSSLSLLFIDDGSSDQTEKILTEKIARGLRAKMLCLSRNFGHQQAVAAGLDHAQADLIAIIDADLQDPPEVLLDMIRHMEKGFDVVYGVRQSRQEAFYLRAFYAMFYHLYRFLSEVPVPIHAGDFCVMRREVVLALRTLPEKLRFQRGLRSWIGFRQCAWPYDRPGRELGDSKYTWPRLYNLATDGIASLSIRPLRVTQVFLFVSALATIAFFAMMCVIYLRSGHGDSYKLWFLATQGFVAFTSALQLSSLYILGAYLGRMYLEVKGRPSYVIMKSIVPPDSKAS